MKSLFYLFILILSLIVSCDPWPVWDRGYYVPTEVGARVVSEKEFYQKRDTLRLLFSFKDDFIEPDPGKDHKHYTISSLTGKHMDTLLVKEVQYMYSSHFFYQDTLKVKMVKNPVNQHYESIDTLKIPLPEKGTFDLSELAINLKPSIKIITVTNPRSIFPLFKKGEKIIEVK